MAGGNKFMKVGGGLAVVGVAVLAWQWWLGDV